MGLRTLVFFMAFAVYVPSLRATLVLYESFDYTANQALVGKGAPITPGNNFGFAPSSTYDALQVDVAAGSLSYAGVGAFPTSAGGQLLTNLSGGNGTGLGGASAAGGRPFGDGSTSTTPASIPVGTYYYSFLFNRGAAGSGYFNVFGRPEPFVTVNNYQNGFGVRFTGGNIAANSPQEVLGSNIPIAANTTVLVVGKAVVGVGGSNTIWINPTDVSGTDPIGGSTSTIAISAAQAALARLTLTARTNGGGSGWAADEVRIGTLLSDVTAVPEPSSFAFAVVATIGSFFIYRRQKLSTKRLQSN
jgi:hypothetical protein